MESLKNQFASAQLNSLINFEQDPEQEFELQEQLGQGNYGSVFKAKHRHTQQTFAIKLLPIAHDTESLRKEIAILKSCDSPYIVRFYGAYIKESDLWLVIEFCNSGSVQDIIKMANITLSETQIAAICYAVLKGLEYLHDQNKIHRDIKAGNILLD
mmetsp:Transcript_17872/g.30359  ORF Transcript_17872/g.30359 Transcript_17872/m.30359 type:complete len:156 (+) Transcript_17872:47-514(+)